MKDEITYGKSESDDEIIKNNTVTFKNTNKIIIIFERMFTNIHKHNTFKV